MKFLSAIVFFVLFQTPAHAANWLCVSPNGSRDGAQYFQILVTDYAVKVTTGRGSFSLNPQDFLVRDKSWVYSGSPEVSLETPHGLRTEALENFSFRLIHDASEVELSYRFVGDGYWNIFEGYCQPIHPARVCRDLL